MVIGLKKSGPSVSLNPGFLYGENAEELRNRVGKDCKEIRITNGSEVERRLSGVPEGNLHTIKAEIDVDDIRIERLNGDDHWVVSVDPDSIEYIRFGYRVYGTMREVYYTLWKEIDSMSDDTLREASIAFDRINTQDWDAGVVYNSPEAKSVYVFRMCYGYTAVYYNMFQSLLDELNRAERFELHVLSIGCGCKSDALALKYAVEENPGKMTRVRYTGIDVANWDDKQFFFDRNDSFIRFDEQPYIERECEFIGNELSEYEKGMTDSDVYAVIFPNMISELDEDDLGTLLDALISHYEGKELYILISRNPINNNGTRIEDAQREVLYNKIQEAHGVLIKEIVYDRDSEPTGHVWDDRTYQNKTGSVIDYCDLFKDKIDKIRNDREPEDEGLRYVIQRNKYIQYEIYKV